jgi:DNA-binding CsgD family transcriptional regulator
MDDDKLSDVIGEIYDAALDPTLWPNALESVTALWEGQAAVLIKSNVEQCTHHIICQAGLPCLPNQGDVDEFLKIPELNAALSLSQGGIARITDLITSEKLHRTLLYRDWMSPHGLHELVFIPITSQRECKFLLIILYCKPDVIEYFEIIRFILPHIVHALNIQESLKNSQRQVTTFEATLDSLRPSVFLLNRDGSLAQANASASAMLQQGHVLYSVAGELRFRDEEASRQIRSTIISAGKGRSDDVSTAIPIVSTDGERYLARLLALQTTLHPSEAGENLTAALALFVYKAELEKTSPLRVIAEAYNLTPAEMRVFLAVVQIGGVPEAAEVLGITKNTIRVLLQRVYSKTGVNRQAELAKLLASFSTPLTDSTPLAQ